VDEHVYEPSHDSYLLIEALREIHAGAVALEIGCGAGPASLYLAMRGFYTIATDINPCALERCLENARMHRVDALIDVVQCSSASCIRSKCIDVVAFNPPYIPCRDRDSWLDVAVCGGFEGIEVLKLFLSDAFRVCRSACTVVFTLSSLQSLERIASLLRQCLEIEIHACIPFFYEELCSAICRVGNCLG